MPSDTQNVKLGVCTVTYDGVDLGYTKGGVEAVVETQTHEVMVDQFGSSPINDYVTGRTVKVSVPLAESTLANLVAIMPGAVLVTDAVDGTKKRVDVTNAIGTSLLDIAAELVLHPIANAAGNKNEDFVVPLAATPGSMKYVFKLDEERIFAVDFKGYPDIDNGNILFRVGDTTATA